MQIAEIINGMDDYEFSGGTGAGKAGGCRAFANEGSYMERKIFWVLFVSLGAIADFLLPLMWGIIATVPIFLFSWWVAYRSEWFG